MRSSLAGLFACALLSTAAVSASAQAAPPASAPPPDYDAALATQLGADAHGMRMYVLVVLHTGPHRMPAGPERDAMFAGHFANIQRLADAGKLAVAGPFGQTPGATPDDWRGLFVFAVPDVEEARALVATDPVVANGEMVAEFHRLYSSAALMLVAGDHKKLVREPF